ncbi:CHAT domain-containing protein [Nannocystis pusilla]|uniref:CHAT domain-containing protein n=1 Tax=Nannocystis pusilla TaxID=889268 RepID=A0ABS7TVF2_9BACT|nr:CHAT domain-containing protein [Nannocystis pusilla]MBZ5712245.1 CHAT domain-containing protein [Nannocystis pusilla]
MLLAALTALRLLTSTGAQTFHDPEVGHVEVSWQCDEERTGRCFLAPDGSGSIVVWYRAGDAVPRLQSAGTNLHTFAGRESDSNWARVELPPGGGRLSLIAPSGRAIWALDVEPLPSEAAALREARRAFKRGELVRAEKILEATTQAGVDEGDSGQTAAALDLRQRIAFRNGHFQRGVQLAERALAAYDRVGWTSRRCELAFALAARHIDDKNDLEAAASILRAEAHCGSSVPSLAAEYYYLCARIAELQERWRDASSGYEHARRLAERLQRRADELGYLSSHYVLADAIHDDAALRQIEAKIAGLSRDTLDLCAHATAWTNIGWTLLMRRQRGGTGPDPRVLFEWARAAYEGPTACRSHRLAQNNRINLALAQLQDGRHDEALALLVAIDPDELDLDEAQWYRIAEIEAHLAARQLERADASVAALSSLALRTRRPELMMHAAYHQGLLHEAQGQPERALAAYAAAEAARDELLLPWGFGAARERAAADWYQGVARMLALSLAAERPAEALCTMRTARRRALRAAERLVNLPPQRLAPARERFLALRRASAMNRGGDRLRSAVTRQRRYQERRSLDMAARSGLEEALDGDEPASTAPTCVGLRSPEPGELQLFYFPVGGGLLMFAADEEGIQTRRAAFPRSSDADLQSETLLAPFERALERARVVRVYVAGESAEIEVHALPWRDGPLLATVPVVYAVDTSASEIEPLRTTATLVVADPEGGLRLANDEADAVLAAWRRLGLPARVLAAHEGHQGVIDGLADGLVFHFIGHAGRPAHVVEAPDPWNIELQLADHSSISVDDVLAALPSAPPLVLLPACETGLVDPGAPSGGLSLAPALVLRGAAVVVATTRAVEDRAASELMRAFYDQATTTADLLDPGLLSRAQAELLAGARCEAYPDLCAFRVWVP